MKTLYYNSETKNFSESREFAESKGPYIVFKSIPFGPGIPSYKLVTKDEYDKEMNELKDLIKNNPTNVTINKKKLEAMNDKYGPFSSKSEANKKKTELINELKAKGLWKKPKKWF